MYILRDFLASRHDIAHVGIFGFPQRRRDTDINRVQFSNNTKIGCSTEFLCSDHPFDHTGRNILNIGDPFIDLIDFGSLQIDAGDRIAFVRVLDR